MSPFRAGYKGARPATVGAEAHVAHAVSREHLVPKNRALEGARALALETEGERQEIGEMDDMAALALR